MNLLILSTGIFFFSFSVKKVKNRIKNSGVKTILPLPTWSIICICAGIFIGHQSHHLTPSKFYLIVGLLVLTIPLQAWIDTKYIYKDNVWNFKDFFFGCSYEIGLIIIGVSSMRLVLN